MAKLSKRNIGIRCPTKDSIQKFIVTCRFIYWIKYFSDFLQLGQEFIIFRMGADPEPHDSVIHLEAQGPPADSDADGIRRDAPADEFELQTGM
jgi:hypothetical protein